MDLGIDSDAALVTASSSGLGKASAKALARDGVDVGINGRDEVAYLSSERFSFVTGIALPVEGGTSAL